MQQRMNAVRESLRGKQRDSWIENGSVQSGMRERQSFGKLLRSPLEAGRRVAQRRRDGRATWKKREDGDGGGTRH